MTQSFSDTASVVMHQKGISGASHERYSRVAIVLHWAIAGFIIFNLCTGYFMTTWLEGPSTVPPMLRWVTLTLHISSGLTVLVLTVARIVWRLLNPPPPFLPGVKSWEQRAAHVVHFLLYAAMVLMPLTGWAILSAHPPAGSRGAAVEFAVPPGGGLPAGAPAGLPAGPPQAMMVWNLIPLPVIAPIEAIGTEPGGVAAQHVLHEKFSEWHGIGGYLLLGVLIVHILGALKHQFIDKESEFSRMWIRRRRQI